MKNRRYFLKKAILGLGVIPLISGRKIGHSPEDCDKKIGAFYLRMQKREMQDKAILFRKLIDKYNNEVLKIVENNVIEQTNKALEKANIENRNIQAVMDNLWNHTALTHEFEITEQTESILKLKVTKCFFAEGMIKLNEKEIGNAFYCAYDIGFCKGLNPDITFTRTKTLMNGDDCCDHCYKI